MASSNDYSNTTGCESDASVHSRSIENSLGFSLKTLAVVMAWGHYFYERDFGLKGLKEKEAHYEANQGISFAKNKKGILISSTKIRINVPDGVEQATQLESTICAVASTADREYFNPVYKQISPEKRSYYIIECPSALETLNQLKNYSKEIILSKKDEEKIVYEFSLWLFHLLQSDENCRRWCELCFVETNSIMDVLKGTAENINLDDKFDFAYDYEGIGSAASCYYFFNYLYRIFSDIETRIERFVEKNINGNNNNNTIQRGRVIPVLLIIVPKSGSTRDTLFDDPDENFIEYVGNIPTHEELIGLKWRPYTSSVYKIKDPSGTKKPFYVMAEFATPIRQLYSMKKHEYGNQYFKAIYSKEIYNFSRTLKYFLKSYKHDHLCHVIEFDDDDNILLSNVLYNHCEEYSKETLE